MGDCIELTKNMAQTENKAFINFQPVSSVSERHNTRDLMPTNLIEAEQENVNISNCSIAEKRAELEKLVKEKTGRTMQKKATPIREAVVLLPNGDNKMNEKLIYNLSDKLEEKYNIKAFQWHIHYDEGHKKEDGQTKMHYHAHIVFDWIDHDTGKSIKLGREDMSEIQTLNAELMEMERGLIGSKNKRLNNKEYRGMMKIKDTYLKERNQEMSQEMEDKLREKIISERPKIKPIEQKQTERLERLQEQRKALEKKKLKEIEAKEKKQGKDKSKGQELGGYEM